MNWFWLLAFFVLDIRNSIIIHCTRHEDYLLRTNPFLQCYLSLTNTSTITWQLPIDLPFSTTLLEWMFNELSWQIYTTFFSANSFYCFCVAIFGYWKNFSMSYTEYNGIWTTMETWCGPQNNTIHRPASFYIQFTTTQKAPLKVVIVNHQKYRRFPLWNERKPCITCKCIGSLGLHSFFTAGLFWIRFHFFL